VVSPEEREPEIGDEVVLVDAEEGAATDTRISADLLTAYRAAFARYCGELEGFCRTHGWGYLLADTAAPFEQLMLKVLREEGLLR